MIHPAGGRRGGPGLGRPPAGGPPHADRRRRVSCSALLASAAGHSRERDQARQEPERGQPQGRQAPNLTIQSVKLPRHDAKREAGISRWTQGVNDHVKVKNSGHFAGGSPGEGLRA